MVDSIAYMLPSFIGRQPIQGNIYGLRIKGLSSLALAGILWVCPALNLGSLFAHADDATAKKITYDDHIRPIFRQYCLSCHDTNTKKSDLALDSYATTMEGGASGEVVYPADLDSSRLWLMVNHEDEPTMPPNADKLPEAQLALLRAWIEKGALENGGSVAQAKKPNGLAMRAPAETGKPSGPAAMPESLFREPVVATPKAAASTAIASSPWAPIIAVAGQHQVSLYHSETTQLMGILPFLEGTAHVLKFSRDGSLLLVAGGRGAALGMAALYDVRRGSRLVTVGDEYDTVLASDVNTSQTLIALGGPTKIVRVYSTTDSSLVYEISKHTDWVTSLAFSPDGELLITSDRSGGTYLWEAETGREVAPLNGHKVEVTGCSWRADSQIVATCSMDGTVRLWNREEGKQVKSWTAHAGGASSVQFAKDGHLVSTGRDRLVRMWKPDGSHLKDLTKFGEIGLEVCITHDGKRVAAGDYHGEIRLLNAENGKLVTTLLANPPTLAMRLASSTQRIVACQNELQTAVAQEMAAAKNQTAAKTEATRRAALLAEAQNRLAAVTADRDLQAEEVSQRQQAITAATDKVKQATSIFSQATTEVQKAETELSTKESEQMATATEAFVAATEKAKQSLAGVESAQTLLKQALTAKVVSEEKLAEKNKSLQAEEIELQKAQANVNQFSEQVAKADQELASAKQEVTRRQAAVTASHGAQQAAQEELDTFSRAQETLSKAIELAEGQATKKSQLVAEANQLQERLAAELSTRQKAAAAAKKQLEEAQSHYDQIQAAVQATTATIEEQKQAAAALYAAQQQAEAAAEQAKSDVALFQKTQEIRTKYQKQ